MITDFFDLFDECYIINLASRKDRRKEIAQQLERVGANLSDGRFSIFEACRPDSQGAFPNIGTHGCFMSHLGVFRKALKREQTCIAILEDDLNFESEFAHRFIPMMDRLRNDNWGIFYGGYRCDKPLDTPAQDNLISVSPNISLGTTHFITFQGETIAKAEAYLSAMATRPAGDPAGGPMHVDGAYNWFRKDNPNINTLIAEPQLGYQRASRTDIHDLGWRDTLPVMRGIVASLRKVKRLIL